MLRLRVALVAAVLAACAVIALVLKPASEDEQVPKIPTPEGAKHGSAVADPFAWTPKRSADLSARAAAGTAHLLYTRSPGGAAVTAERVKRYRKPIERAAKAAGVNADRLEALVFLESAGRPEAQAPGGVASAAGLTQILAETATGLLGMKVDQAKSASYTRRLNTALREGNLGRAAALNRARRRVDDRFDPAKALNGTARYLKLARQRFGREDLAFVSYHMGMGNLENVLKAFGGGRRSYAELYFDSTPQRHPKAYAKLASFGDDSSNYFWKLSAAMEIMRMARSDPDKLARIAALQTADDSARAALLAGAPTGGLRALPNAPADTSLTLARPLELRPEALGVALYMAAEVRSISNAPALRVTGVDDNGWTFRVSRKYASDDQAQAFQYVLDRLQVLNVIAWSRSATSISVTASRDADVLEPLLDRAK
ncbi:transglycosylase SLT domain-containing protein [Solirubrobacter soli]|uniref:transglycosylase SLT domain-containing protein n=1 Tax=Solirubrobacter soli TaxID=363832 RepID=UPI0003F898AE|nr:transglycosylase SLT domain-containing protein [Solirubrobacter soli]